MQQNVYNVRAEKEDYTTKEKKVQLLPTKGKNKF
jgi:hypothetical protein